MILVDTSVWVDHFRRGSNALTAALEEGRVLTHPFVLGELACGNLRARSTILEHLGNLPRARIAEHDEVLRVVEQRRLAGTGIGWVDVHLVAATLLAGARLWTLDKALATQAKRLRIGAPLE